MHLMQSEEVLMKLGSVFTSFAHMDEYLIYQVDPLPSVVLIPIPIPTYSLSYKHLYPHSHLGEAPVVLDPGSRVPEVKLLDIKEDPQIVYNHT